MSYLVSFLLVHLYLFQPQFLLTCSYFSGDLSLNILNKLLLVFFFKLNLEHTWLLKSNMSRVLKLLSKPHPNNDYSGTGMD